MISVDTVSSSSVTSYTSTATDLNTLGKEDFLTLLVAQMENQDPLEPQDSTEFIAQLAQYSSLEQQITSNEKLDSIGEQITGLVNATNAFSLLGRDVVAATDSFNLSDGSIDLGIQLDESASAATLNVLDSSGSVVASLSLSDLAAGNNFVTWDGTDASGEKLPAGTYSLSVSAVNDEAESVDATPLIKTAVSGVEEDSAGGTVLVTSAGNFYMDEVSAVYSA